MHLVQFALRGAAAGAAGTTALNAATPIDMAGRGRPASSAPEDTVETLAERADVRIPGEGDTRRWSTVDWASDVLPHLAYGLVTAATLQAVDA